MTTLLSAEFSNDRRRALAVSAVATIGFPVGGVIGGLGASYLLTTIGWPAVFVAGSVAGGALLILAAVAIPESPAFLVLGSSPDARTRLNAALVRLGQPEVLVLPPDSGPRKMRYLSLFAIELRAVTLTLILVNLLVAMAAYFLLNWLPQLVADAGFSPATGSAVSAVSELAGLFGGLAMGAIAGRVRAARLVAVAMVGFALSVAAVGVAPPVLSLLTAAALAFGFFLSAMTGTLYATIAEAFPSGRRASGMGLVMGVGRIASAIGPAAAGWMFAHGMSRAGVSLIFAVAPLMAAVLITGFKGFAGSTGRLSKNAA